LCDRARTDIVRQRTILVPPWSAPARNNAVQHRAAQTSVVQPIR
jgi:hypothetical protein